MANPQKEDGYTGIAHDIMEALSRTQLSEYEASVVFAVLRLTYGWNKKVDLIALSQLEALTGIERRNVWRAVNSLGKRNILKRLSRGPWKPAFIGFQKDYELWQPPGNRRRRRRQQVVCTDDGHVVSTYAYQTKKIRKLVGGKKKVKSTATRLRRDEPERVGDILGRAIPTLGRDS